MTNENNKGNSIMIAPFAKPEGTTQAQKNWNAMMRIDHPYKGRPKKEAIREIYNIGKKMAKKTGIMGRLKYTMKKAKKEYYDRVANEVYYVNDIYQVIMNEEENSIWLSIKNHDRTTDIPWQHKQWIKNDLCGEEAEAVELFPAQSRIWNTANQYHLFVMKDNVRIPIGFDFGGPVELKENASEFGAKQTYQSIKPSNG